MNRFTIKDKHNLLLSCPEQAIQKLGQLEDIEEELGIEFITLFKALFEGFYYKDAFGNIEYFSKELLKLIREKNDFNKVIEEFKNYGKTWALTKEELEKCNK